jgi:hypothetical protein
MASPDAPEHYALRIADVFDGIEPRLRKENATDIAELAERALRAVERRGMMMDDDRGALDPVGSRLESLYLRACRKSGQEMREVGRRIALWERESAWGVFHNAGERLAGELGKRGVKAYLRARDGWP